MPTPSSSKHCALCGVPIPPAFPAEWCPGCMMKGAVAEVPTLPQMTPLPGQNARPAGIPSVEMLRRLFPDLDILELLGAGGMGAVYKVRQPRLNRLAALKVMVGAPGHEVDFALRFEREAQVLARLNHPHIVIIYDFGDLGPERTGADPLFYFLMEYVDGTDLGQLIKSRELKPAQALTIVPQICEALQYAHDQGITHRDIKPANLLLDQGGRVKIADFGLAKMVGGVEEALMTGLTQTGTAMGTPHYMAPEQWENPQNVDHRADIYALGVVFYEMLTGERPAGVFEPPSRKTPSVNKKLDGVVLRAMEKEPARRYQQAGQIGDDVTRISGAHKRKPATPNGAPESKRSPLKPLLYGVTFGMAVLALGAFSVWRGIAPRSGGLQPPTMAEETPYAPKASASSAPLIPDPAVENTPLPASAFPTGQWTKVLANQAEVDAIVGLQGKVTLRPDGWLDFSMPKDAPGVALKTFSAANAGVRVKLRIADKAPRPVVANLTLRQTTNPPPRQEGYRLQLGGGDTANPNLSLAHYDGLTRKTNIFKRKLLSSALQAAGDEILLEFYTIGSRLIGRVNGELLPIAEDTRLTRGIFTLQTMHLLRDIELIHLDGLSEDEALKLAGVKGADIPAVVGGASALPGPSAPPSQPGRLEGIGTLSNGRTLELVKFDAYADFVDVAAGADHWVALRATGEMVSSDGQADFQSIRKIARSFQGYHCFITQTGELRFHPSREMTLPASLKGGKVVDAACGSHHGVALLEDGRAVVFGRRYEEEVDDMSKPDGTGTPRWPQPEPAALQNVKGVAATYTHAATLHHDGSVSIWGWEGAVKWQPEPEMKPVRQISSHHDNLHLLDEAGQVWSFPLPRSAHPQQPVGFKGSVKPLGTAAVRLRDHLWLGADDAWHGVAADRPVQELLERTDLQPETTFALLSSTANAIPFGYVLWIEPVTPGGAVSPSPIPQVTPSSPATPTPFTDREAAEWVLGLGYDACNVKVLKAGKLIEVRKLADLPAEPWVIQELRVNLSPKEQPELWGKITDAQVMRLTGLRFLKIVDLRGNLTGASLKVMAHHPGLESLLFEGMNLKADDLQHLRASRLPALRFHLLHVTDPDSLAVLATMANLRKLQLTDCLDPALVAALPKLPKLEMLQANGSINLTDEELPLLVERFPQLTLLQPWGARKLKGTTLGSLMALKSLTTLGLTDTSVNDEGLAQIAGMPQLLTLDLGQTRITDACLPTLKSLPKLESLQIFQTELTDAALLELASIPTLKRLGTKASGYSDYKPRVTFTAAGIAAFEKLRPDVQVVK